MTGWQTVADTALDGTGATGAARASGHSVGSQFYLYVANETAAAINLAVRPLGG